MKHRIWNYNNPHPKGLTTGDCAVRAMAIVRDTDYLEQRLELQRFNRKVKGRGYKTPKVLKKYTEELGFKWKPFQAETGKPRMRGSEFVRQYPKGKFLLRLSGHIVAVVDGVYQDIWDSTDRVIYGMWEVVQHGKQN